MSEWTEGVCDDGAAILRDGERVTISELLEHLNSTDDAMEWCGNGGRIRTCTVTDFKSGAYTIPPRPHSIRHYAQDMNRQRLAEVGKGRWVIDEPSSGSALAWHLPSLPS